MAKYQKKKVRKKRGKLWFGIGMVLYAAVFLYGINYGLQYLWNYIDCYEQSRYQNTVRAYMDQVTPEYISGNCEELIALVDHNIQSEDACRVFIEEAAAGKISHAKKAAECTETHLSYAIRLENQIIGSATFDVVAQDEFGFPRWEFTGESFDLSYLMGEPVEVTVPHDYPVFANGVQLDERYVTESGIQYEALLDYYEDYELPTMSTYQVGPCLGQLELVVKDKEGEAVTIDEDTDMDTFVHNCSEKELEELETFVNEFLTRYIRFTGNSNRDKKANYENLKPYILEGSKLYFRMENALDGLTFAQSKGDVIQDITVHHYVNFGGGRYLCDMTYLVDTTGREGVVQTTTNMKLLILETEEGLKAESMINY